MEQRAEIFRDEAELAARLKRQMVAIDMNPVDLDIGLRKFFRFWADDRNLPAIFFQRVGFLPDAAVEWQRQVLNDENTGFTRLLDRG